MPKGVPFDTDYLKDKDNGDYIYYVQEMSEGTRKLIADELTDSEIDSKLMEIFLRGTGDLYRMPIEGGASEAIDSGYATYLYTYPKGLYYNALVVSDIEILEVDEE